MYCSKCGASNPDGAKFCVKCAAPMAFVRQPSPAPAPKKRSKAPFIIGVIAILFALLIGGGVCLASSGILGTRLNLPASVTWTSAPYMHLSFYDRPAGEIVADLKDESFSIEISFSDGGSTANMTLIGSSAGNISSRADSEHAIYITIAFELPDGTELTQIESADDIPATAELSTVGISYNVDLSEEELVAASREVVEGLGLVNPESISTTDEELYNQMVAEYGEPSLTGGFEDIPDYPSTVAISFPTEDPERFCTVYGVSSVEDHLGLVVVAYARY